MPRRLLIVAYFFPPVGGVGVERTLKHVTYLPESGWQAVVIAPRNSAYRVVDEGSLVRIPAGTQVHRALTFEPAHARRLMARILGRRAHPSGSAPSAARPSSAGIGGGLRGAVNAVWATVIPLVFFPDQQLLWVPAAILAGWRAHRSNPVDAIYSSSPPVSGHLAAMVLKGLIDRPWIADFRDPWIGNAFAPELRMPHRRMQASLERQIVTRANLVVLATAELREQYLARYPSLGSRLVHIPNGYDLGELTKDALAATPTDDSTQRTGQFHLIHAGSLYGERELNIFLDGVGEVLKRRPELRDRLRVDFVGWFNASNMAVAARRLPEFEPVVHHLGLRPRPEAIARERSADAALVLLARDPASGGGAIAPAKMYEYIGLDLPILAVAPHGAIRKILEELEWGVAVDPTALGVADGIERIMAMDGESGHRIADPERRYERRSITGRLVNLLDTLSVPSREPR